MANKIERVEQVPNSDSVEVVVDGVAYVLNATNIEDEEALKDELWNKIKAPVKKITDEKLNKFKVLVGKNVR